MPDSIAVPEWIAAGKLRWVWALWEPIELYARGGYGAGIGDGWATGHWVRNWYERMHSDEILDKLAEAGVNLVSTHFYKGFGLQAESAEMDRAADYTARAHQRGIRVLGYHQFSTVIYETMLDEIPNLEDWVQRGPDGSLRTYGSATWRWMACPSHDEFIAYLKRVMDRCLTQADMDGVEFDGTAYDCHCEACQQRFRAYLSKHHPDPLERFGIPHFDHVRIPVKWHPRDPVWQEWVRFRIDLMGSRLREMRAHVHETRPGAALVTYEDCPALWRKQRTRLLPDDSSYLDLAVAESHDMPQVLDGQLVTKIRHLKEGTAIDCVTLSTDWLRQPAGSVHLPDEARPVELDMAECLACGGHVLTATWALRSGNKRDGSAFFELPLFHEAMKRYMGFARENEHLYRDSTACANVWIYHSLWSLAFDHERAYDSVMGWEQALLGQTPWRIAKQRHLGDIGPRDLLIVAGQSCLSDDECSAIAAAEQRGAALIVTGNSGEYDEDFRQRVASPLLELRDRVNVRYLAACPGRGSHPEYAEGKTMLPFRPERALEIANIVFEMMPDTPSLRLRSNQVPPLAYIDIYRAGETHVAHVVYYGHARAEGMRLEVADWVPHTSATLHSPYLKEPVVLKPRGDGSLPLPDTFGRYCAVELK